MTARRRGTARRRAAGGVLAAALVLVHLPAWGQAVPQSVQPGQLKERYQERPLPPPEAPEIPGVEEAVPPAEAEKVRFVLSGVVVEGATVYDEAAFVPFYEDRLAKEISLAEVYRIAAAITKKYQDDGYILSRAVVPKQDVEFGIVHIRVVEGWVDDVTIRGEVKGDAGLLEAYGRKITESRPLHVRALERYVLLIDDLPGVVAKPTIRAIEERTGAYRLAVFLEHSDVDALLRADNRGSRFVGPFQGWIALAGNSTLGLYERTEMRLIAAAQTEELRYFELSHAETVGTEGTKVTLTASHSRSRPGFTLEPSNIASDGTRIEVSGLHPLIRSSRTNLFLTGRLTYWRSNSETQDQTTAEDRLRVAAAGATMSFRDDWSGRNEMAVELSQGLDIFDATDAGEPNLSRPGGRSGFTKVTVFLSRFQPIDSRWSVLATAKAQKSANKLLVSEQIGLGGEDFGRAYDPSEITGDDGAAVRIELRHDRLPDLALVDRYQPYVYYDVGAVWTRGPAGRASLASAGLGVRALVAGRLSGYVEVGFPLTRPVEARGPDGNDARAFFSLNLTF